MNHIISMMQEKILLFDGAMGTMLQRRGLKAGELPELLNLTAPEQITAIHREYVLAVADIVTANTFQAHELKLGAENSATAVVQAGIACAKKSGAPFVALDVGPLGKLLEPLGPVSFEKAYEIFKRQISAGAKAGADLIIIETIFDLYEAKAAILAAKESTDLPVFCTMTFQEGGRTFLGCDAKTAVTALQALGVDAVGVNCSLGPASLRPVVDEMLRFSRIPVIVQANAGLPELLGDTPVYSIGPAEYADAVYEMVRRGVRVIGGCCGTSPEYIRELKTRIGGFSPVKTAADPVPACSSGTRTVILKKDTETSELFPEDEKEAMLRALDSGEKDDVICRALDLADSGTQLIRVNAALPGFDEAKLLPEAVKAAQEAINLPLLIESADAAAAAAAMRIYNGRPVFRPGTVEEDAMANFFVLCKKYGAVIALPELEGSALRRVMEIAGKHGFPEDDLITF